jgi:hypothetical protein
MAEIQFFPLLHQVGAVAAATGRDQIYLVVAVVLAAGPLDKALAALEHLAKEITAAAEPDHSFKRVAAAVVQLPQARQVA